MLKAKLLPKRPFRLETSQRRMIHPPLGETIVAWESNDRNSALPEARKGRASGRERVSAGERTVKRLNIEDKSGSAREILFSV